MTIGALSQSLRTFKLEMVGFERASSDMQNLFFTTALRSLL